MECKLFAGQKVMCVDPHQAAHIPPLLLSVFGVALPDKTTIYTVASLEPCRGCGTILVQLKEIQLPWNHFAFRPLQDRPKEADTDISVFTPLLNTKELVKEPAQ